MYVHVAFFLPIVSLVSAQSCKENEYLITIDRQTKYSASLELTQVLWNRVRVLSYLLPQDNTFETKQFCIPKHSRQWYTLLMNSKFAVLFL